MKPQSLPPTFSVLVSLGLLERATLSILCAHFFSGARCARVTGYSHTSWKRILNPGFQDGSRLNPKYVPRARDCCVIELIPLPFQICDRIFQRVTSDSIKCNGSFVRSLYGRICRGGQGGYREIVRDRGWLRGMVWSGRVEILHVCTNHN